MIVPAAERSFEKGLASLATGEALEAMAYFEAALRQHRAVTQARPHMKYQSFFWLCLARHKGNREKALRLCREAADAEFYDPEVFLNLGRVAIMAGDRRTAYQAFQRGLHLDPGHKALRSETRQMGVRKRPLFGFLQRTSPLNRAAGRLRRSSG
jgi:tetratricopeptide (TPR) repeat protein